MKIITNFGKDVKLQFGYYVDKEEKNIRCFSIIFIDFLWDIKTRKFGIAFGIPFIFAIGFFFNKIL